MHDFDPYQELLNCQHNILELAKSHSQQRDTIRQLLAQNQQLIHQLTVVKLQITALQTDLELLKDQI